MKMALALAGAACVVAGCATDGYAAPRQHNIGRLAQAVLQGGPASGQQENGGQAVDSGLCGRWDSATRSRFHHTIEAPPGRVRLRIEARTTASGGETVAVYPSDNGDRGRVRIMFVIATTRGHTANGYAVIPSARGNENLGRLPVIVDVENAGGRRNSGDYCITVHPEG